MVIRKISSKHKHSSKKTPKQITLDNYLTHQYELSVILNESVKKTQKNINKSIEATNQLIKQFNENNPPTPTNSSFWHTPFFGLILLLGLIIFGCLTFFVLALSNKSSLWAGYMTSAIIIALCAIIINVASFSADEKFKTKLKKLEITLVIAALCISLIGIAQNQLTLEANEKMINYAQEQSTLVQEQIGRTAKISFSYPFGQLTQDTNMSTGFWIENTGYRTILLEPHCVLFVKCDDLNELTYNLAPARVVSVATERSVEDFNFFEKGSLILKIGDRAFFSTPNQIDQEFSIDSNRIKNNHNCFVSCIIRTIDYQRIGDANIQIKQN
ncbi:MAG: hypothetical protein WC821_00705 [archaeon]|jgi:hypothetical protein